MLFIRRGPLILFMKCETPDELRGVLNEIEESVIKIEGDIKRVVCTAMDEAGEADTIAAFQPKDTENFSLYNAEQVFSISDTPTNFLAKLISCGKSHLIDQVEPGPSFIVMRVPTPGKKVIDQLAEHYSATAAYKTSFDDAVKTGTRNSTILLFSDKPISRVLSRRDILQEVLFIPQVPLEIYKDLRTNAMQFFTRGLEDEESNWYELKINIYDSNDQYFLHLDRLYTVLSDLELGFVINEEWTRDQAFIMMSVPVYQVKLFTLTEPKELKKIIMGLEYDEEGNRLVDMDIYFRNRKVERNSLPEVRKMSKEKSGITFRKNVIDMISKEAGDTLKSLEGEISDY
ncbi:hypothetical protein [Natranaerobius thermophilus]|uniref:DUF4868 domain-containing protein n=1 Tax=Natranaerobius thermophilus (strain ATCC BAA-1301 / DSM 18059 / JW/NM-WN-LF) TaxID=457570 RepID=B2A6T0_NATTJ|nr:hypothetical protein [Natranaerobius thermophilus]ACB84211.1 conserved hypothetical protein [Natranaerobius thermophilus JW/NM-WN-LF]